MLLFCSGIHDDDNAGDLVVSWYGLYHCMIAVFLILYGRLWSKHVHWMRECLLSFHGGFINMLNMLLLF